MTRTRRQPRPLTRDKATFRDDRLFYVACDDTYAPKQYFDFFRLPRVHVHMIPTVDGTCGAAHVLERLLQFEAEQDDELWMLLDTDHYVQGAHLASFIQTIAEAKRRGVNVALSRPSFELWLLLHHVDEPGVSRLSTAQEVEAALRSALGQYNKTRLRQEHYPLASVRSAFDRAGRLDKVVACGEIPDQNTTRVYRLWQAIVTKSLPTQLPPELRGMQTLS